MRRKLFSIITATYNCGQKLEQTIESVLSQKKDLFEFIIVDGGSTDGTLSVLKKYEGRLKFISEKDEGVYDAFNKGIEMSSGKYLYFLGAGDILRKGILERLEEEMPCEGLAFVYGKVYLPKSGKYYLREFTRSDLRIVNICHQSIFYARGIFDLVGNYDLKYTVLADWALNLKCFAQAAIRKKYVSHVIADYEEGGLSQTQEDPNFWNEFSYLIKDNLGVGQHILYKVNIARVSLGLYKTRLLRRVPVGMKSAWSKGRRVGQFHEPDKKTDGTL